MKRALPIGLVIAAMLSACGGSQNSSLTPSPPVDRARFPAPPPTPGPPPQPAPTPPPPPATGTITPTLLAPGSGASLEVRECRMGQVTRLCAPGWRGTFDVVLDRDFSDAVLTVMFYAGDVLCGYAADTADFIPAAQPVTFRPTVISLSDEFGLSPCNFPATTTRVVMELWNQAEHYTALKQEFASTYTFIKP